MDDKLILINDIILAIGDGVGKLTAKRPHSLVCEVKFDTGALFLGGKHDGSVEFLCRIVQCLPPAVVVKACPGSDGPAVIELPIYRAHAPATVTAHMLCGVADGVRLHKLRHIDKVGEGMRVFVYSRGVLYHHKVTVGDLLFLVPLDNGGEDVHILFLCEGADGFHVG